MESISSWVSIPATAAGLVEKESESVVSPIGPPLIGSDRISDACGAPFFDDIAAFSTAISDVNPCNIISFVVNPKMAIRVPGGAWSR